MPRLMLDTASRRASSAGLPRATTSQIIQQAMSDVVNGPGTAGRARLPIDDVLMAGKTGTAQVVALNVGGGKGGQLEVPRPRPVHLLRPVRQAALCRGGGDRARRRLGRGLPDRARRDDLPVRSGQGAGGAARAREAAGAAPRSSGSRPIRALRRRSRHRRASRRARPIAAQIARLVDAEAARRGAADRRRHAGAVAPPPDDRRARLPRPRSADDGRAMLPGLARRAARAQPWLVISADAAGLLRLGGALFGRGRHRCSPCGART